jgi:hypothetical protein
MNKKYNNLILSLVVITTTIPLSAWFGSDNAGSNFATGALTGAGIGGLAGGGRGAGYGALAGGMIGLMSTRPSNDDSGSRSSERAYNKNSRSSMQQYINQLELDNQNLRNENDAMIQELSYGRTGSRSSTPRTMRGNYNPKNKSSMRQYITQLEQENQRLQNERYDLSQQINDRRQENRQLR